MDTHTQHDPNNPINYKEDREEEKNLLIYNTLQSLSLEYLGEDATDYISNTEDFTDVNDIFDDLQNNGFFTVEIIYYYKAIEYLKENDYSLHHSLEIANEYGYTLENLNSELLASLHASRQREDKFWEDVEPKLNELI
tara:strand:- start:1038 stop:1451 length:414 start_codon:yes stop_codon:yes gene_type:complete